MNFGEKLKHIRTEKNLTQPQFAEVIGIEQSYLSKLENDKSQPSSDMFSAIVKALEIDPEVFLGDIDKNVLQTSLRHIPEVRQFLSGAVERRVHHAKKWLFGAACACAVGFALMLAANDGIFSPNDQYKYTSKGVILRSESDNVFEQFKEIQNLKLAANTIRPDEHARLLAEFEAARVRMITVESWGDRGSVFFEDAGNGRRKFELVDVRYVHSATNKVLQYLGALFAFCGVLAFLVEWRMRKAVGRIENTLI
ncbi:helix-turn-helix domain-containing protein [Massilia glaciei]|uniref:XRE family transcriptional regulator n=1 Tax=Massilia glaciei TaxID=1524097 RepID=A0A2U2HEG8_9BURK|nr:helix-turn-helix transcriptional regulator [Massilia glaciei]PWF42037.1 XRE family transcriptional regulator [Massilia glaciei]